VNVSNLTIKLRLPIYFATVVLRKNYITKYILSLKIFNFTHWLF